MKQKRPASLKELCIQFQKCSIKKLALRAIRLLEFFDINTPDSIKQSVLVNYGKDGFNASATTRGITIKRVTPKPNQLQLIVANKWIKAATLISNRLINFAIPIENIVDPEVKRLLNEIKKTENLSVFKPNQNISERSTQKSAKAKSNENVKYSNRHRLWAFSVNGNVYKFDTKANGTVFPNLISEFALY